MLILGPKQTFSKGGTSTRVSYCVDIISYYHFLLGPTLASTKMVDMVSKRMAYRVIGKYNYDTDLIHS